MTLRMISQVGLAALALCIASCSSDLIRNPNVERWCGPTPCDWKVEGEVERVGTWHPNDYAVSLVSDDAALIQENATVDYRDTDCFDFAMVAKIDRGVDVYLELDFLADGTVEFSQRLPVSDWERRTFRVTAPDWYSKVRFIIRKDGPGLAILAEITAKMSRYQCSAPAIELLGRPAGALCNGTEQCAEALSCKGGSCGGCDSDQSCENGQVCGLQDIEGVSYYMCIDAASTPLGAACDSHQQCETGLCLSGACSECASDEDCEDGTSCSYPRAKALDNGLWPKLCAVGQSSRQTGAACTENLDCQSGSCEGFELRCEPYVDCTGSATPCIPHCRPKLQLGTCR